MDVVLATRSAVAGERGIMTIISWTQMQSGAFEELLQESQWKSTKGIYRKIPFYCGRSHFFQSLHQAIPI